MKTDYEALINQFYGSFNDLDSRGMSRCYHQSLTFEDPAFGEMNHYDTCMMWQMLCESQKGKEFEVTHRDLKVNGEEATVTWEAHYFFRTGRKVHNVINASFKFQDGLIVDHRDRFNLYKWSRMALGMQGLLVGWTPFFKSGLEKQTRRMLEKYKAKNQLKAH